MADRQESCGNPPGVWRDRTLWTVVLVAFALRLGLLVWAATHSVALESTDTPTYTRPALSFLAEGTFSQDEGPPYAIDTLRTPGYPLFLAVIWLLGQTQSAVPVALVQAVLGAAAVGLVYAAGWRVAGRRAAIAAALLLAFESMSAALPSYLLSDAFYQFAVALWLLFFVRYLETRSWGSLVAASIVAGLSLYVRPVGLLFPVATAILIAVARPIPLRRRSAHMAIALFLPAALIFPWCLRNKLGADTWEFTTIASKNMLRYRAAKVMSMAEGKDFYTTAREELERRAAERTPPDASPGRRLAVQRQVALEYMAQHPWLTAQAYATGAAVLLAAPDRWTVPHLLGVDERGGTLHAGDGWLDKIRRLVEQYHPLTLGYMVWAAVYLAALWLLACVGLARLWRNGRQRLAGALVLALVVLIAASAVPESEPRLRLPILSPLIMLAGATWMTGKRPPHQAEAPSRTSPRTSSACPLPDATPSWCAPPNPRLSKRKSC